MKDTQFFDAKGAITPLGDAARRAICAAVDTARRHTGGTLAAWARRLSRNEYTREPRRPLPDKADRERAELRDRAKALVIMGLAAGLVHNGDEEVTAVRFW